MTLTEQIMTIGICVFTVQFTRLLPFFVFPANRPIPQYIRYLGKVLPPAMFGMLVVYCYKNIDVLTGYHGIPDFLAGIVVLGLFLEEKYVSIYCCWYAFLYGFSTTCLYLE